MRWVFEQTTLGGYDLEGGDIQDKMENLGLIERREVDPAENEWDADYLYFLKSEPSDPDSRIYEVGGVTAEVGRYYHEKDRD